MNIKAKERDIASYANTNIHNLAGKSVTERESNKFKEYRQLWDDRPKRLEPGNFPLFLDIEMTNYCNLKCPFCATTYFDKSVKRGYIDFDLFKRIIDEGRTEGLYGVKFNDRGEPLLHKQITDMVKYAKDSGLIDVYFNTNAQLLTEQLSKDLIRSGMDRITFSIEGYTKDIYEKNRVGGTFEKLLKNIRYFREFRDQLCSTLRIRIQSVRIPEMRSKEASDNYIDFWNKIADEVCIIDQREESDPNNILRNYPHSWICPQLYQRMVIWWDGSILPCYGDDNGQLILGNARDISIKSAWNSVYLNILRGKHQKSQAHDVPPCDGCSFRDSEIKKLIG